MSAQATTSSSATTARSRAIRVTGAVCRARTSSGRSSRSPAARPRAADLFEDRLEHDERREDVLAGELARTRGAPGRERLPDRAVLLGVLRVEAVDRVVAR